MFSRDLLFMKSETSLEVDVFVTIYILPLHIFYSSIILLLFSMENFMTVSVLTRNMQVNCKWNLGEIILISYIIRHYM